MGDPSSVSLSSKPFNNILGDNFDSAIWSAIESNTGIVCASLPHFKPLISRYMPSLMGIRSTAAMTPLSDGPTGRSRLNMKASTSGTYVEMEHGNGRWDSYKGDAHDNPAYSVAVMGKSPSGDNNSNEHLRDSDNTGSRRGGIYKGTSVTVSRY